MRDTLHLSLMNISVCARNGWKPSYEYETTFLSWFIKDFHNDIWAERTLTRLFLVGYLGRAVTSATTFPGWELKLLCWPFPSLSHLNSPHSANLANACFLCLFYLSGLTVSLSLCHFSLVCHQGEWSAFSSCLWTLGHCRDRHREDGLISCFSIVYAFFPNWWTQMVWNH